MFIYGLLHAYTVLCKCAYVFKYQSICLYHYYCQLPPWKIKVGLYCPVYCKTLLKQGGGITTWHLKTLITDLYYVYLKVLQNIQ